VRLLAILFASGFVFAQAPPITGVGSDAVTSTTARIHWTAGFYHDTASDTTLSAPGFTTTGASQTINVGTTSHWVTPGSTDPITVLVNGLEYCLAAPVSGTTGNVVCGADATSESHYQTRTGVSYVCSAGTCTATVPYPLQPWWDVGHKFIIHYARTANLTGDGYAIASRPDSTHFTFSSSAICSPCDFTSDPDVWMESNYGTSGTVHVAGETISMLGTDHVVCYGDAGGSAGTYPHSVFVDYNYAAQQTKHWEYITGQAPGTTIHYIVLSTPRQFGASNCSSIGAHTGQSADQTVTFLSSLADPDDPVPPSGVSFSTALPGSYTAHVATDATCSTLQTLITNACASGGTTEIKIPAANTCTAPSGGWLLCTSPGMTIRTDALDSALPAPGACLPPLNSSAATAATSPCIDNPTYASSLVTLQTAHPLGPVFALAPYTSANNVHLGPGLKIQPDPLYAAAGTGYGLVELSHAQGGGQYGHAYHPQNFVIDRVYFFQKNISSGMSSGVNWYGGNSFAVVDSVTEGLGSYGQDLGAINIASPDLSDGGFIIKNNRLGAAHMSIFAGDSGWNTADGIIQRNYLYMDQSRRNNSPTYPLQRQNAVASVTTGNPTTITLVEETDLAVGLSNPRWFSFIGATGSLASKINAKEFLLTDGSLADLNCNGANCIITTGSAHGFTSGDTVYVSGLAGSTCVNLNGPSVITVTDATHMQFASGINQRCTWPDAHVLGPMFEVPVGGSNSVFTIPLDSSSGTIAGTITARHGYSIQYKNPQEMKTAKRWDISGNVVEGSAAVGGGQEGQCFTLTNRIMGSWQDINNVASLGTISDIYMHDNWCRSSVQFMAQLGAQDNGSSIPMQRVKLSNNLATNLTGIYCEPGVSCGSLVINTGAVTPQFKLLHNTIMSASEVTQASGGYTPPAIGRWVFNDNIFGFGSHGLNGPAAYNGGSPIGKIGAQIWQTSGSCSNGAGGLCALPDPPFPNSWIWHRNVMMGNAADGGGEDFGFQRQYYEGYTAGTLADYQEQYWPRGITGIGFAGLIPITGATNASPIVISTGALSCTPAVGDYVIVSGVRGNLGANNTWRVKASTSTSVTLQASVGSGTYTAATGNMMPVSGSCDVITQWALGSSSHYKACAGGGDTCRVLAVDYLAFPDPSDPTDAGVGPASDATNVGANIANIEAAISGPPGPCVDLSFFPSSATPIAAGGIGTFNASVTDSSCNRGLSSSAGWLTCTANCSGTGSVSGIGWTAAANAGASRSATLFTSTGVVFSVTQGAVVVGSPATGISLAPGVRLTPAVSTR